MKNVKDYTIKIEGSEWEKALDTAFKNKNKELKVDGFRKGACPKDVYLKKFGLESLYMDAVDAIVNVAYKKVIEDNKLEPVCEPKVDVTDINETSITLLFTVITHPEVTLGKYKNLGIKKEKVEVTKEEIDAEIKSLRDKYADVVEMNDSVIKEGSTATINFTGVVDGKPLEGGNGENYPLEIGSNTFIPGFESGLVGMKLDEEKVLKLKFPENYVDNLKNKDVEFTVKIVGIKQRILPELNEDFYKDLGYNDIKTVEEFEGKVKEHLMEHKTEDAENKYLDEVLKKATDELTVEINPEIIEEEVNRMINQYREQLQMQGLTLEQYLEFTKGTMESLRKLMEPEATNRIKARYLLEAVAEKEKVEVTDKDVEEEINKMVEMYQVTKDDLINMIGGEDVLKYDVKMRKSLEVLKNN